MTRKTMNTYISELSGVGKTRAAQLNKLGIFTVRDLIYLFPRAYEKRGNLTELINAQKDETISCILTVTTPVKNALVKRGLTVSKFRARDDTSAATVVFFNSPFVKDVFSVGCDYRFYGKVSYSREGIQLTNPKYEPVTDQALLEDLIPVYPQTAGISSKFLHKICKSVISEALADITDPIPEKIRIDNSLPTLSFALKNIHFPESDEALKNSLRRLAFDEIFIFGVGISVSRHKNTRRVGIRLSPCDLSPLLNLLPYELTASQKAAVNDIYKDAVINNKTKPYAMSRILIGDVGSGKTICALIAAYITIKSGYQAAIMAPTEILARQHFADAKELFDRLGIKTEILVGASSQKEKSRVKEVLRSGECDLVIGTHALLTENVEFAHLGMVIEDEQHRFGILQRSALREKAPDSHLLVMSATPIPRTLALTMYGDLELSRLTDMPKGRMRVDTYVVDEGYRERLNSFIEKQIENGGQCYVVCPAIEGTDEADNLVEPTSISELTSSSSVYLNIKNAVEHADYLGQKLKNIKVECLHGKMKAKEKNEIMSRFSSGETKVLVSTTVIEVGVNVPNATLMVVENAERFGLSQLHQLRGRVGRGSKKSYCVLVSGINTQKAKSRLNIMKTTYDGYEIAEKDLVLRGPGDFFATADSSMRQSGGFEFRIATLCDNEELFSKAFLTARELVDNDPDLSGEENLEIKKIIEKQISSITSTIS